MIKAARGRSGVGLLLSPASIKVMQRSFKPRNRGQYLGGARNICANRKCMNMSDQIWYISGPMTGKPDHNYPAFHEVEEYLSNAGHKVLNPARNFDGRTDLEWETYMRKDVQDLLESTHVMFLPGWHNSRGARVEYQVAKSIGLEMQSWDGSQVEAPIEYGATEVVRNGERQTVYGHPAENLSDTAKLWSVILGQEVTAHQVALCMTGVKLARLKTSPGHVDSVLDTIGYMVCYDRITQYESGNRDS